MNTSQKDTIPEFERTVECVFCIDCSAGMAPHMEAVKRLVKDLIPESLKGWAWGNTVIRGHCAKIIMFRNYETDGEDAISESRWFDLVSDDAKQFEACLNSLQASGGADTSNGLEALFYAMTTDWNALSDRGRQIIILFSNTDAVPLGAHAHLRSYPTDMVDTEGLLVTWFGACPEFLDPGDFKLKERLKRMLLYAPAGTIYEFMMCEYNRCRFEPIQCDSGFNDIDAKDAFKS